MTSWLEAMRRRRHTNTPTPKDALAEALKEAGVTPVAIPSGGGEGEPTAQPPVIDATVETLVGPIRSGGIDTSTATLTIPTRARSLVPRPYQIEGIEFLRTKKRAMLGDAPGLGKTLQAAEAAVLPAVVSCPLSLVGQWEDFLNDQYPDEPVTVAAYGDIIKRTEAIEEHARRGGWLIVNHDMWRTFFIKQDIGTLIVDEYHHMRNREAKRSRGLWLKAQLTPRVYGLTATPVFKDVGDLYHLLHILDKNTWSSYWSFVSRFAITSSSGYGSKIIRMRNPKLVEAATKDYLFGRSYAQVGMWLPQRIDKQVMMRLTGPSRERYNKLRDYYRLELEEADENGSTSKLFGSAGAVLHALRKLTITPEKIAAIQEIIDDTPGTTPILVFCWYRETAQQLAEALGAAEITGAIKAETRRDLAQGMQGQRVRVATMESLSEGVDLSDFRTVIYAEETYVPGQQYQSLSRVLRHRTDTDATDHSPVVIYWVRYIQTVDQVVHTTAQNRIEGNAMSVLKEALTQGG